MLTVKNIHDALFAFAPESMKMGDWDNVGLLCGREERSVSCVLVSLDVTPEVAAEAAALGAECIVTHHPALFDPIRALNDRSYTGELLLTLAERQIAVISLHTNLDCAPGGVNDTLAQTLGLRNIRVLDPIGYDAQGRPYGLVRMGETDTAPLRAFAAFVRETLACPGVRIADAGRPVRVVAVGGGSCGSEIDAVLRAGCDTFVTADLKYHQFAEARFRGINLIDAGHFETENPICAVLASVLRRLSPELRVELSKTHRDAVQFL